MLLFFKILIWPRQVLVAALGMGPLRHAGPFVRARGLELWLRLLRHMGIVAPRHVWNFSSPARPQTCVPALQGRFLTTGQPGNSLYKCFLELFFC